MGRRSNQFKTAGLTRFLVYMLGHRPDEFGLVPDREGFLGFKELLQALHEEPEWRYVRQAHIHEVLLGRERDLFQWEAHRIRAVDRRWQPPPNPPSRPLPKVLYTPVRRKAHPVVMEKGVYPAEGTQVVLTGQESMALRIGRRRDQKPVLLEVVTAAAEKEGVRFHPFGALFLSAGIPAGCIAGPPVAKEVVERRRRDAETKKEAPSQQPAEFTPGTFLLDPSRDPDRSRQARGKKRRGWKEKARKLRRGRQ